MSDLASVRRGLRVIGQNEVNQLLRLFGHWPIPPEDFELPPGCLTAVWLCDYLACMGILDPALRESMIRELQPWLGSLTEPPQPTETNDACIRLADRRYLYSATGWLDLATGERATTPARQHVEKTIFDLAALYRRRQGARHEPGP